MQGGHNWAHGQGEQLECQRKGLSPGQVPSNKKWATLGQSHRARAGKLCTGQGRKGWQVAHPALPLYIQSCFLPVPSHPVLGARTLCWPQSSFTHQPSKPSVSTCCVPDTVMVLSSQELSLGEPVISKHQGLWWRNRLQSKVGPGTTRNRGAGPGMLPGGGDMSTLPWGMSKSQLSGEVLMVIVGRVIVGPRPSLWGFSQLCLCRA